MTQPTVAVIGCGFSGLCAAIKLKEKLGIQAQIYEAKSDVGGTWNNNTYPGCASDVETHLYSFSFELNPYWSHKYSPQKEIHQYLKNVAKKHQVYQQVQFNTRVVRTEWKEDRQQWEVEYCQLDQPNEVRHFDFVFFGLGSFGVPNVPEEFKSFEGKIIHSVEWDHTYDYTDKRMAVIGSGTSAVQIVSHLAPITRHLYSIQRSPAWVVPANQMKYTSYFQWLFAYLPFFMLLYRATMFFVKDLINFGAFKYAGSLRAKISERKARQFMESELIKHGREDLIDTLIPTYALGCKRIAKSDDYLATLCRKDVTVIASDVTGVEGKTITTGNGQEVEVDVVCLATGFKVSNVLDGIEIYGRHSIDLKEIWEKGPAKTYKTVNIHQFPNLFMLLGPGSGLGHSSVISIIEAQVDYSVEMIGHMIQNGIQCLDPTEEAQEAYYLTVKRGLKGTVWETDCNSWYKKNGEVRSLWPFSVMSFFSMLKDTAFVGDYEC